jgi:C-terminal processing protease CtpA/Prc
MTSELERIERLVGLCKLWGAVKYFHPYLAYRDDIDWDAALVAAIPRVRSATSGSDYAQAVQEMLLALDDPATRVIEQVDPGRGSSTDDRHPVCTLRPDGLFMVKLHHYEDLVSDFEGAITKLEAVKAKLPEARGILFDLRSSRPLSQERGWLAAAFYYSGIATMLSATPLVAASTRSRTHLGFVAQRGLPSPLYRSAFTVVDGRRIEPSPDAKEMSVVFLVNSWSELPPEALALQLAGKAVIVAEGSANDASLVKVHPIALPGEIVAEVRLEELVYEDGTGGFQPDVVVAGTGPPGDGDAALEAALEILAEFAPRKVQRMPIPVRAVPPLENAYPEMAFPPLEYRLLAAFRMWAVINYFFPYKELMDEDWEGVLREFIPRMEEAESALDYHLAVAEMVTHIHDSHGYLDSPILAEHFGPAWPPIRLQMIEDMPVITTILDEEAVEKSGVSYGDVVLKIDGQDVAERMAQRAKYIAASTPQRLQLRAANAALSGPAGSVATLLLHDRNGQMKEVQLARDANPAGPMSVFRISWRRDEIIRLLSEDIGYADLDRLEMATVDEMFEKFKNTKAIIFDMRGYPKGTAWAIAPRLSQSDGPAMARLQRPVVRTPDGPNGEIASQSLIASFLKSIPLTEKWRYQGKTIMLIDERAQSQAEGTGLFFEAANNTTFVGSPTSGANGDVTNLVLPGGVTVFFTGTSVRHADGRQLQRVGLVPDIEVRPTVKGIQEGRDEVLESAVAYLQRQLVQPAPEAPVELV